MRETCHRPPPRSRPRRRGCRGEWESVPLSFPPRTSLLCGSGGRDFKKRGEISPRELFIGAKASCGSVRGRRKNNSASVARYLPRAVWCGVCLLRQVSLVAWPPREMMKMCFSINCSKPYKQIQKETSALLPSLQSYGMKRMA